MYNGCSGPMLGDTIKFLSWKAIEKGNVTFGNNDPGKIIEKGVVILSNGKGNEKNVLYVYGLKHNLLSVSHMCDQGYDVIFKAKICQLKYTSIGEIVVKYIRTNNNVYFLKEKI